MFLSHTSLCVTSRNVQGWWLLWKKLLSILRLGQHLHIPNMADVNMQLAYISHNMMLKRLLSVGKVRRVGGV